MAPPSQDRVGLPQTPDGVQAVPLQSASDLHRRLHCMAPSSGPKPTGHGLMQVAPLQETPGSPSAVLHGFCALFMMQSTEGRGHPARGGPGAGLLATALADGALEATGAGGAVEEEGAADDVDGAADLGLGSGVVRSSSSFFGFFFEEQEESDVAKRSTSTSARRMRRT